MRRRLSTESLARASARRPWLDHRRVVCPAPGVRLLRSSNLPRRCAHHGRRRHHEPGVQAGAEAHRGASARPAAGQRDRHRPVGQRDGRRSGVPQRRRGAVPGYHGPRSGGRSPAARTTTRAATSPWSRRTGTPRSCRSRWPARFEDASDNIDKVLDVVDCGEGQRLRASRSPATPAWARTSRTTAESDLQTGEVFGIPIALIILVARVRRPRRLGHPDRAGRAGHRPRRRRQRASSASSGSSPSS